MRWLDDFMKITGKQIIEAVVKRLKEENILCYDSAIVTRLKTLNAAELAQLTDFGDVTAWHNARCESNTEVSYRPEGG